MQGQAGAHWSTLCWSSRQISLKPVGVGPSQLLAKWLTFSDPDLQPFVAEAVQVVIQVIQSDNWSRVLSAETRYAEVPFAVCRVDNGRSRNVVEGVIDLVYRTSDGWEILDYKSDRIAASDLDSLVRRYAQQLHTYRAALAGHRL